MPKLKDFNSTALEQPGRKNSQNYCVLINWSLNNDYTYLFWSFDLQAPIGNFMIDTEAVGATSRELIDIKTERLTSWTYRESELFNYNKSFNKIIAGNHAGLNNETLTWDEIKELYK